MEDFNNECSVVFVYGSPYLEERHEVWYNISSILSILNGPCLIMGDFNQIEFNYQKKGGNNTIPGASIFRKWRLSNNLKFPPMVSPSHGPIIEQVKITSLNTLTEHMLMTNGDLHTQIPMFGTSPSSFLIMDP